MGSPSIQRRLTGNAPNAVGSKKLSRQKLLRLRINLFPHLIVLQKLARLYPEKILNRPGPQGISRLRQ